jgi:hypothetical protein
MGLPAFTYAAMRGFDMTYFPRRGNQIGCSDGSSFRQDAWRMGEHRASRLVQRRDCQL